MQKGERVRELYNHYPPTLKIGDVYTIGDDLYQVAEMIRKIHILDVSTMEQLYIKIKEAENCDKANRDLILFCQFFYLYKNECN